MTLNGLGRVPTLDELLTNPGKVASLTPEAAQTLLIGLASIHPILIQRALMGGTSGPVEDELLTIPAVAKRLKISEYKAYELARQGILRSVRLGKSVRVRPVDLSAYVAQQGGC
ncbi:MAG: helix-turn-helix domain-containing protein [Nitrospira sp.]|nr:helix-turn-helix domain-containing protein [Nitrospira sp.]